MGDARFFIEEAYKHGKPIGAADEGLTLVMATDLGRLFGQTTPAALAAEGVVTGTGSNIQTLARQLIDALAQHRCRDRKYVAAVSS